MLEVFKRPIDFNGHSLSGKTDPQICLEVLQDHGYTVEQIMQALPELLDVYIPILEQEVSHVKSGFVHKGVPELLLALEARADARLGLLTGNIERGARIKLKRFDLNRYFSFGAFGCDSANRMELPAVAHKRAHDRFSQEFSPNEIVIIGDARNDVLCARGYGAKALAVCTGKTTKQELVELEPDYIFDSLTETDRVIEAIFAA